MKKCLGFVTVCVIVSLMSGCAKNVSPNNYEVSGVGVASKVVPGVIIGKRAVKINTSSEMGGLAGAVAGAAGGSAIGGSAQSNMIGAVGGAVVGGVLGNAADKAMNKRQGFEYIVKLDDGSIISITQEQDMQFALKQRVLIICGAVTRIVPNDVVDVK